MEGVVDGEETEGMSEHGETKLWERPHEAANAIRDEIPNRESQIENDDGEVPSAITGPGRRWRRSFESLDAIDLAAELKVKILTFQSVPRILRGAMRNAFRLALESIRAAALRGGNPLQDARGWKLFVLASRLLLHKPPGTKKLPPKELTRRAEMFQAGSWRELLMEAHAACPPRNQRDHSRESPPSQDEATEKKMERATALVHLGELSAARRVLVSDGMAEGTQDTLRQLNQRPQHAYG